MIAKRCFRFSYLRFLFLFIRVLKCINCRVYFYRVTAGFNLVDGSEECLTYRQLIFLTCSICFIYLIDKPSSFLHAFSYYSFLNALEIKSVLVTLLTAPTTIIIFFVLEAVVWVECLTEEVLIIASVTVIWIMYLLFLHLYNNIIKSN